MAQVGEERQAWMPGVGAPPFPQAAPRCSRQGPAGESYPDASCHQVGSGLHGHLDKG